MAGHSVNISVRTKSPNFGEYTGNLKRKFDRALRAAHHETVARTQEAIKSSIIDTETVASGKLLNSLTAKFTEGKHYSASEFASSVEFRGEVAEYAHFANYGREPGMPPPRIGNPVIERWIRDKMARGTFRGMGGRRHSVKAMAWIIGQRIAMKGTRGKFFLERAEQKMAGVQSQIVSNAIDRFLAENRNG